MDFAKISLLILICLSSIVSASRAMAEPLSKNDLFHKLQIAVPQIQKQAPSFSLKDLNGKRVSLSQFRRDVVLINFWATWCEPCRAEMPALEKLWQQKIPHFVVLGISVNRRGRERIKHFAKKYDIDFPILLDRWNEVRQRYKVEALPQSYIISPDGKLRGKVIGTRDWPRQLMKSLVQLLRGK